MTSRFRFAPVSGAASNLINVAVGYFILNGALWALLTLVALAGAVYNREWLSPMGDVVALSSP